MTTNARFLNSNSPTSVARNPLVLFAAQWAILFGGYVLIFNIPWLSSDYALRPGRLLTIWLRAPERA